VPSKQARKGSIREPFVPPARIREIVFGGKWVAFFLRLEEERAEIALSRKMDG
jgi:hypothetical protein